ncbi:MAG: glycosyltransferase family 2 protein [Bacteroidetes bacterium]|nr:glycosyltransferase family 2 protein [Bacteroidota bacterium]
MNNNKLYSVIVPVYNSESSLVELFDGIMKVFNDLGNNFEVIFVDDNSRDNSWETLSSLKKEFPDYITAVSLSRNFGQHNATLCGFSFATGDYIITIDDDLQTPPSEIRKLIEGHNNTNHDLTYGVYRRKKHSVTRNIGSRSLKTSARVLRQSPGEGSSFRLISGDLIKKIGHHQQNFIFLDEVFHWYTDDIAFVEVDHQPRKYDKSGYSIGKLVKLVANLVMYYTMVPLKVLVYGGLIISLITFIYGLFFIIKKLVFNVPLGYTSLIVTILFSTSIILFSLGVLGEYLSRIYQLQNRKPPYSIRKAMRREKN